MLLLCVSVTGWAQQNNGVSVVIKQNGKALALTNGVVHLKNTDFVFEVKANQTEGVFVAATYDKALYLSAIGEAELDVPWFENTAMADDMYNPNKEIVISDELPNYWFYTNAKEHRFDKHPKGTSTQYTATRTIHQFNDLANYEVTTVANINKPVYVFLYVPTYNDNYDLVGVTPVFNAELKF